MKKATLIISTFALVIALCLVSLQTSSGMRLSFKIFPTLSFDFEKTAP